MFSVAEYAFAFIVSFPDDPAETKPIPAAVRGEMITAALLAPMAFSNLRADVRPWLSISDASEQGGAAAESKVFVKSVGARKGLDRVLDTLRVTENEFGVSACISMCCICATPLGQPGVTCPLGCHKIFCCTACGIHHVKRKCSFRDSVGKSLAFFWARPPSKFRVGVFQGPSESS